MWFPVCLLPTALEPIELAAEQPAAPGLAQEADEVEEKQAPVRRSAKQTRGERPLRNKYSSLTWLIRTTPKTKG
jgi:hypothetical protein